MESIISRLINGNKHAPQNEIPFRFGDIHKQYIADCANAMYNIAEGAVRAGKTVDNVYAFSEEIKTAPDKIHIATGSTAANAKLNIGDANGFGLEYIFEGECHWGKFKGNECLYIKGRSTMHKEKIVIFAGGAKADSFKKIRGNSYGMWIGTEINLHHDNTIKEVFNRTIAAKRRKIFWDLNPDNPGSFIYTEYIDRYKKLSEEGKLLGGYNYQHFTIHDNITISEQRKAEIISQYDPTSIWYLRDILGKRCVAEGLIYPDAAEGNGIVKTDTNRSYIRYYISVDYGTLNPCSMGLWGLCDGVWYRIREYYYNGRETKKQLTDDEYYTKLETLAGGLPIREVIIDPSAASFITLIQRKSHFHVRHARNSVVDGIRATAAALQNGAIKIQDCCTNAIAEFSAYRWDDKSGEDKPIKENDHAMDDIRYFVYTVLEQSDVGFVNVINI